jgi:sulfate transporter 3
LGSRLLRKLSLSVALQLSEFRKCESVLNCFVLSFFLATAVGSIDTSGTSMLDDLRKNLERRGLQVREEQPVPLPLFYRKKMSRGSLQLIQPLSLFQIVLANPGSEVMKKLHSSRVLEAIGHEWIFPTVGEAAAAGNYVLHSQKPVTDSAAAHENMV